MERKRRNPVKSSAKIPPTGNTFPIRLNKYIANSGVCSRRDADELIKSGQIKVNGETISEMGYQVQKTDKVSYDNKLIRPEKFVYVLLNKPKDFITTMEDTHNRRTVMDLVEKACQERIFPVGRLDRNTTGILLFTNDGALTEKLTHPSYQIKKIYQVELDKPIVKLDFEKLQQPIQLEDGEVKIDDIAILSSDKKTLGLEIHVGKNRIVRRIFEHVGYEVIKLDRTMYGPLTKKDLPRGKWRFLTPKELIVLKNLS
ncbi:pseudouridine synthase [Reichenbachiella sp. MALMAid0571]|uniref:pseudouridine synthase n=1 Tax=Reichenbachiella sp. MALMAid0571 TaxID=3143939 RepID=UPI0032DE6498